MYTEFQRRGEKVSVAEERKKDSARNRRFINRPLVVHIFSCYKRLIVAISARRRSNMNWSRRKLATLIHRRRDENDTIKHRAAFDTYMYICTLVCCTSAIRSRR